MRDSACIVKSVMVYRVIAVVLYLLVRLLLTGCRRIGRVFHVGALPIAAALTVATIAATAAIHLTLLREQGAQPLVILSLTVPALIVTCVALAWRRRTYDPVKAAHRYDGWIDN
ncbi:conserved hypothetical protein [Tsukamurella paurometabola DSM 20162]|uniref:Uncharacterized protein n=1 Tax=Tsukamurella paurometabola (strain ATCC 8368 / DSM 20162 / CCUG 35730 / CIP 100753 / JCM 10117 / KCTC 9821 / NBRC 16120 / NCIMB 702349 / NCTC 13040) TaxID=521096 RepID=D5UP14_TSUPD|nr:conserved hypothetical protein [Tsukamurella paurometabola DSM 20162]